MTVRVRIAPSPTGKLHIGTARTAVFNWLFARRHQGQFILRIEDTDTARSRPEFTENIVEGLSWLGLNWDEGPFFQSKRTDLYLKAIQTLLDSGHAYRCYCTPEELDQMRAEQKARGEAPRYDNRHRHLSAEQQAQFESAGRKPVIRFKIDDERTIAWDDMVRGRVTWKGRDLGGDMVIARAATATEVGQPLYNLVVVVDDADMGITHVIRGEDHIGNTPKQILLYEALGAAAPEFGHTPLILNQAGQKLSKRDGVTSISDFKDMGFVAPALANYMTLLGWSPTDATQELFTLEEAAQDFDMGRVNKAGAKFDWDRLDWMNSQYLHNLPIPELVEALTPIWEAADFDLSSVDGEWKARLAALIGPSLTRLQEAVDMSQQFFAPTVSYGDEAQEQLQREGVAAALQALMVAQASESLTVDQAKSLIKQVTKEQGVKKGLVMRSLRAALTGEVHGPDLIESWILLDQRGWARSRLETGLTVASAS